MVIAKSCKTIIYLSKVVGGRVHDYALLQGIFNKGSNCFEGNIIFADLGYQGITNDYKPEFVVMPVKRKKSDVTSEYGWLKRTFNKLVSQMRMGIEHAIGGMKKFRLASQTIRIKSCQAVDTILGVCAGLWNYSLVSFERD